MSRNLIFTSFAGTVRESASRPVEKALASSLLRNFPDAEIRFIRRDDWLPLFKVERKAFSEVFSSTDPELLAAHRAAFQPGSLEHPAWRGAEIFEDAADFEWVLYLGPGSLALRSLDHLLAGDADVLWAGMQGVRVTADRCRLHLSESEQMPDHRADRPVSRPWREAASAAVWAVRGAQFRTVIQDWKRIAASPVHGDESHLLQAGWRLDSSWNRCLIDTPLKVARFEREEVQFPCLPGADFMTWKEAALLNVSDWPQDAQSLFVQAWFYGTYFSDPGGVFLEILDP